MSFHLYSIREIHSSADGTMQFIELQVGGSNFEDQWAGHTLQVRGATTKDFVFDEDLPSSSTANTHVLLATQAFQAEHGIEADFTIPEGFLFTTGGVIEIQFIGTSQGTVTYDTALLPLDGLHSLTGTGGNLTTVSVGQPQNFAGQTVTLVEPNSPPTGEVVITGTAAIGEMLTADTSGLADADGLGAFGYQWLRDGEVINGADDATYQVVELDGGHQLSVRVSYEDGGGTGESVTSDETGEIAPQVNPILGTAGNDDITGTAGVDSINALGGNDTVDGAGGNDTISGGSGTDTVVIDSSVGGVTDYSIVGIQVMVRTAMGRVVMNDVERVLFDDVAVAFDTEEGEAVWQANALLWAAFGSAPGTPLLSTWVAHADVMGNDMHDLAGHLLETYAPPSLSDAELVYYLFGTLLGIAPSQEQLDQFTAMIGPGQAFEDQAAFLAFAAGHEVNTSRMAGFEGSIQFLDPSVF